MEINFKEWVKEALSQYFDILDVEMYETTTDVFRSVTNSTVIAVHRNKVTVISENQKTDFIEGADFGTTIHGEKIELLTALFDKIESALNYKFNDWNVKFADYFRNKEYNSLTINSMFV